MSDSAPRPAGVPARRNKPVQMNVRVSTLARDLLERIADRHGFSMSAAVEFAVRQTARAEGVWLGDRPGAQPAGPEQ